MKVVDAYEMTESHQLGFPAAGLDRVAMSELVAKISEIVARVAPDIVYVNHIGDIYSDHPITFKAARAALKPFNTENRVGVVYAFETLSETDESSPASASVPFQPTSFVDVTAYIDGKIEMLEIYESEIHAYPGPREASALKGLARYRGSSVGMEFAEAFVLVRETR